MIKIKNNAFTDIVAISLSRIITMVTSLVQAMILARVFSKYEYGTYSQTLIVITLATNITGLGLSNAVKYFISKSSKDDMQKEYFSTIMFMNFFSGIVGAIMIVALRSKIAGYFSNTELQSFLIYVAFRPMIANLVSNYQNVFISNYMSKYISIRNIFVGIIQLTITTLISLLTKSILHILILFLLLDVIQIFYFSFLMKYKLYRVEKNSIKINFIKEILKFSLPMAFALMIGTLNIEVDKLMIGRIYTPDEMAVYSTMSRELPFSFFATAISTVVLPRIIKNYVSNDVNKCGIIWSKSISLGFLSTLICCTLALMLSKQVIMFLYSEKYLSGNEIFKVYIFVQLIRFTYFGTALNANSSTKMIMVYSLMTLAINIILNYIFLKWFGFTGPAYASFISIALMGFVQLLHGSKIFRMKIFELFNLREIVIPALVCVVVAIILIPLKNFLINKSVINILVILIIGIIYLCICFLLIGKKIIKIIRDLNQSMKG